MITLKCIKKTLKTKDGKDFDVFKTVRSDGKLVDLKFTKNCAKMLPTGNCEIHVPEGKMNIDRSRLYDVVWVQEIEEVIDNPVDTQDFQNYFEK